MSDIVKAALIIGVAFVLSQGFYEFQHGVKGTTVKMNKLTGTTYICVGYSPGSECYKYIDEP